MEAPVISPDVLARYAGDAALDVNGVSGLARDAAEVTRTGGSAAVVVHVELQWGAGSEAVARQVQARVAEYLGRMAELEVVSVDVLIERVGGPPAKR